MVGLGGLFKRYRRLSDSECKHLWGHEAYFRDGKTARSELDWMLRKVFMPEVHRLCPGIKTPEQLAAITDFAFNLGTGRLKTSTLRKRINAEDWDAVPDELRKWTRGGGRVLRGLVARREAEILLLTSKI